MTGDFWIMNVLFHLHLGIPPDSCFYGFNMENNLQHIRIYPYMSSDLTPTELEGRNWSC